MTKTKLTLAEVTAEVISAWKAEHGKVSMYVAADGKTDYFKSPDMQAIEASMVLASTKPLQSNLVLAKAAFLGGDVEVFEDPQHLYGLGKHLNALIVKIEGELTEL